MFVAVVLALILVVLALVLVEPDAPRSRTGVTIRRRTDERWATRQWWPEPDEPIARDGAPVDTTSYLMMTKPSVATG